MRPETIRCLELVENALDPGTWDSPSPELLTITDDYELESGEGVEFYWQTRLAVTVDGSRAVITGARGRVALDAPAGCAWRVDELPLLDGIQRTGATGVQGQLMRTFHPSFICPQTDLPAVLRRRCLQETNHDQS